ncbi:MAG TPA: single-stranded-DNA-specific exonuclease RecJ [Gammaproteobacteria bacterium]|nr:single-stranded-DNA-specific exonuclease RecJ [Gammaproteobacteria bacterium]
MRIERRAVPGAHALPGDLHPVLARVLAARGVLCADDLSLRLDRLLPVGSLSGIEAAVRLLLRHLRAGSRILVVGDFDADGATSTVIAVRALRAAGAAHVDYLVPNRFEYGYGLTPEIVALAAPRKPALIVTVDNGISSHAGIEAAHAQGAQVLVTDHHLPGMLLPPADAIVNPNLPGEPFASKHLCGAGVAFYLMAALHRAAGTGRGPGFRVADLLDLVALGTVADVVTLDRNNRVLVEEGLRRIRAGRCVPGMSALLEVSGRCRADAVAADLAFGVAPRLNAAGRLADMSLGIECLLTDDQVRARELAARLHALNAERREIEARMQTEAIAAVEALRPDRTAGELPSALCLFDERWHQGIVGLVAARIRERVHRPVAAFAPVEGGWLKGSARSVPGLHIRDVLDAVAAREPGLLDRFGGHAMAAGLSLPRASLERFQTALSREVTRRLTDESRQNVLLTDGELDGAELTLELAECLRHCGPWGQGFPEPVFEGLFDVVGRRTVGASHLKLSVRASRGGAVCDAIAFNQAGQLPPSRARLVYRLDVNAWRGARRLQLVVESLSAEG